MKREKRFLFVILLFVFITFITGNAVGGWRFVAPMPHPRYGHDATLGPDGKIYVMDGFMWYEIGGRFSHLVYDPQKDICKYLEPVPGWVQTGTFWMLDPDPNIHIWRSVRKAKGQKGYFEIFEYTDKKGRYKLIPRKISLEELRQTNLRRQGDGPAVVTSKDGLIYWYGGNVKSKGYGENIVLPYDPVRQKWPEAVTKVKALLCKIAVRGPSVKVSGFFRSIILSFFMVCVSDIRNFKENQTIFQKL